MREGIFVSSSVPANLLGSKIYWIDTWNKNKSPNVIHSFSLEELVLILDEFSTGDEEGFVLVIDNICALLMPLTGMLSYEQLARIWSSFIYPLRRLVLHCNATILLTCWINEGGLFYFDKLWKLFNIEGIHR